ncbi:MAG TPA: hypothetical protein DCL63_06445 [Firmicutes bacterium]|jgi:peptidoglycan hydrolase-like protein with peptidoglycan-binding domain|nr:hypothetical protein [Bacillota bacterium]
MRKLAVLLAAIMVAALALPVSAATIDLGGKLESQVYHDFAKGTGATTDLELTLGVGLVGGQNVKGVVKMSAMKWQFNLADGMGAMVMPPAERGVMTAYVETVGPYWMGGPSVATRIGDLDLAYSPFVLKTDAVDGISVSGATAGPVGVDGFYGWANSAAVRGARAKTEFAGVGIDGALVKVGDEETDYMAHAAALPIPDLAIEALYAGQSNTRAAAIRAAAAYKIPFLPLDVTASAGYRRTGAAFDPTYRSRATGNPLEGEAGVAAITAGLDTSFAGFGISVDGEVLGSDDDGKLDNERSIGAAVSTQVAGFDVAAGHKVTQYLVPESSFRNTTNVGIGFTERQILPNLVMSASYNATMTNFSLSDIRHVAKAAVGADIGAFRGVSVSGLIDTKPEAGDPGRELGVEYAAPCGVNLGYSYNDVDTNRVYAGMEVSF